MIRTHPKWNIVAATVIKNSPFWRDWKFTSFRTIKRCWNFGKNPDVHWAWICSQPQNIFYFSCDHCGKFYWSIGSLQIHQIVLAAEKGREVKRIIGGGQSKKDDRCKCDICGAEMPSRASIEQHMRHKHSTNRIICGYCHQDFNTEYEKKVHLFTSHVDIYPIGCEICDERFEPFSVENTHSIRRIDEIDCFVLFSTKTYQI